MQRGVIEFTKTEIIELLNNVDLQRVLNSPLGSKLISASESAEDLIKMELSEDEIEIMLDQFGIPDTMSDTEEIKSIRQKMTNVMVKFRTME